MQVVYYIKTSLPNYYKLFYSGKWELPDFSEKCPICGAANCAVYLGFYTRCVESPEETFSVSDFPVIRVLCRGLGKKKCDDKTASYLPYQLIPYRQMTIFFIILTIFLKLQRNLSAIKTLETLESLFSDSYIVATYLSRWALYQWELLIMDAFERFIESDFHKSHPFRHIIRSEIPRERFFGFLKLAIMHMSPNLSAPKGGPEELGFDFYLSNDGPVQLALFLFGVASQHRK